MIDYARELAKIALRIGAIKLNPEKPFRWASGYYMPIYNDNRLLLGKAEHRQLVSEGLEHLLKTQQIPVDIIAGTSTAGISPGTTLADKLELPFIYIRDKPKDHGLRNRIEGLDGEETLQGKRVVVVEDLISTGGSSLKAVQAVRDILGMVHHLVSIFNYGLSEAAELFADAHCEVHSLLSYDVLLQVAREEEKISAEQLDMLEEWRKYPFNWGEKHGYPRGGTMTFADKWNEAVAERDSILCVGLDPAEYGQRADYVLPQGTSKLAWSLEFIERVAPHAAAIKANRNFIKDLSREETQRLVAKVHEQGMLAIDDSKLADIGDTNDSGWYHAQQEGFDAVTYAPFPGNTREAVTQAHARGLGLIGLVLMSNPEFEVIKNATIRGMKGYEYFALQMAEYGADGAVIGAPSENNHLTDAEVRRVHAIVPDTCLVLMPGVGAQEGEARYLLDVFGDRVIANVGRAIMYGHDSSREAAKYKEMLNGLRR